MMIGQSGPGDSIRGHQSAEDNVPGHSGSSSGLSYLPDLLNISTSQVGYRINIDNRKIWDGQRAKSSAHRINIASGSVLDENH